MTRGPFRGMGQIYVIHENAAWVEPLREGFSERGLPFEEWFLDRGVLDLGIEPPHGVFYNRMSASSHTRGHRYGPEYAGAVLGWLGRHGRRVINDGRALQLEISKVAQYAALSAHGVQTPKTVAAVGRDALVDAARRFDPPFITKHNRAGKGLGVRLFREPDALVRMSQGMSLTHRWMGSLSFRSISRLRSHSSHAWSLWAVVFSMPYGSTPPTGSSCALLMPAALMMSSAPRVVRPILLRPTRRCFR